MRVLFLLDTLGGGGAERSLQELLPEFVRLGINPVVACFHRREQGVEGLVAGRYELHFLGGGSRFGQMRAIRRLLRRGRFDLMHTTLFEADVFGRPAALGTGVPIVTSLVNMPYQAERLRHDRNVSPTKLLAARLLEAGTGRFCAEHFHAISSAVKRAAIEHLFLPQDRITVVHRGRDPGRLGRRSHERRLRVRQALGIDSGRRVILSAARQEYQKGQGILIEAMAHTKDRDSLLLIAGRSGSATADLHRIAAPVADRVVFLGHRDDIPDLMAASDVFALPSLWEGLGCVLLEAMALELPIIASDLPPVREVTSGGAAALLVRPGDAGAIARALDSVQQDLEGSRGRTARARALFEERFTIERSAQLMSDLFRHVREQYRSRAERHP